MNVVNNLGGSDFRLMHAILIREQEGSGHGGSLEAIASVHPIKRDRRGRATVGAGQFLNSSGLRALVEHLMPERRAQFIDARVLATGAEGTMWWRPAQPTMVWFKTNAKLDGIGEAHGRVPLPSLVFFAGAEGWFVFAVKGKERPTRDTPLFQTGMYNVWRECKICVGNAAVPRGYGVEDIDAYERAFFESRFTHPNIHVQREVTTYRGGAGALWKSLLGGKKKAFPEHTLVPIRQTVGQWLDRTIKVAR